MPLLSWFRDHLPSIKVEQHVAAEEMRSPTRDELVIGLIRLGVATAISFFTVRYLVKYMDPTYESKKKAKEKAKQLLKELGVDPSVELSDHEMSIASNLVNASRLDADWSDIGGCESLVGELMDRVILPLKLGSSSPLLSPPKGVLLYGPPGCGKTLTAKAMAKAAGARFINLQVSGLKDMWYGETQKLAAAVFTLGRKIQPTIIFIDEIDSFLRLRQTHDHEATAMMKAQFMSAWDGFATDKCCRVVIVGATNRPNDVDKAIIRRMPARFHVKMPDVIQRAQILDVILRGEKVDADVDLDELAKECPNLSGSDLKEICRIAAVSRAKELIVAGVFIESEDADSRPLAQSDLLKAITIFKDAQISDKQSIFLDVTALD